VGFCTLSAILSMAAHGGIADALGATVPPQQRTPASPSRAVNLPSLDSPAGGITPNTPARNPRNPDPAPMPVPAATHNYASSR
jgi:hypothetical protein